MTTKYYSHKLGFRSDTSYAKIVDDKEAWFVLKRGGRRAYQIECAQGAVNAGRWIEIPKPTRIRAKKSANKVRYYRNGNGGKWPLTDYVKVDGKKVTIVPYEGISEDISSLYPPYEIDRLVRHSELKEIPFPLRKFKVRVLDTYFVDIEVEAKDSAEAIRKAVELSKGRNEWNHEPTNGAIIG